MNLDTPLPPVFAALDEAELLALVSRGAGGRVCVTVGPGTGPTCRSALLSVSPVPRHRGPALFRRRSRRSSWRRFTRGAFLRGNYSLWSNSRSSSSAMAKPVVAHGPPRRSRHPLTEEGRARAGNRALSEAELSVVTSPLGRARGPPVGWIRGRREVDDDLLEWDAESTKDAPRWIFAADAGLVGLAIADRGWRIARRSGRARAR
jgi:hypothetical protein